MVHAPLFERPYGVGLRVFIEPEYKGDLLWSELAPVDNAPLEQKASDLRGVLPEKGWTEL